MLTNYSKGSLKKQCFAQGAEKVTELISALYHLQTSKCIGTSGPFQSSSLRKQWEDCFSYSLELISNKNN